ncbi:MAG: PfkB family carbohydrate kinase [Ferruginibacter sp.]
MSLIVTITPNPCIDTNSSVPELLPDKKLQCTYCKSEPGGGGINVSRVITRLGGKTIAVYIAGGYNGNFLTDTLQKDGIESIVIKIKENTRQNFIVMDESTGLQYRFGMPGPTIKETELQECLQTIDALHDVFICCCQW